ncbi:MAG: class I adenylate-forming enzyme family protein [Pseudomonadota bacterium]
MTEPAGQPSVAGDGAPPTCPTPYNLAEDVLKAGRSTPDKTALCVIGNGAPDLWSYGRLSTAVGAAAAALLAEGLRPGDRVLLRLGNGVAFPIAFLGAVTAGLIPVPTSAQLTKTEIAGIADFLAPCLVVASPEVSVPPGRPVISDKRVLSAPRPDGEVQFAQGPPDRLAYIVLTSGTSGKPRAVAHAHRAHHARRMMWKGWYGLTRNDRVLHAGAMNWTFTLGTGLLDPWTAGATALVPGGGTPIDRLPDLLKDYDATIFAAAPGVYRKLLNSDTAWELPRLRHGLCAGETLPHGLREAWRKATGTELHEAYGQSECSTLISGCPDRPAPEGTTGFAQPGRRVAVVNSGGVPLPRGKSGRLVIGVRDPGLMLGYLSELGAAPSRSGAWHETGDDAIMRDDGAIRILGRNDDVLNAGGYRVSPEDIESVLCQYPAVTEAAAVEVAVKADTTVIAAYFVSHQAIDIASLASFASDRLAGYKMPRILKQIESLPRGANGKLQRARLRKRMETPI